jgi:hypothetical protein
MHLVPFVISVITRLIYQNKVREARGGFVLIFICDQKIKNNIKIKKPPIQDLSFWNNNRINAIKSTKDIFSNCFDLDVFIF